MDASDWFIAGTVPLIAGGGLHVLAGLLDTARPTFFAPIDDAVRPAMEGTGMQLVRLAGGGDRPRPSIWSVWLGIHLSHGLGVCGVGLLCLVVASHDAALVEEIAALRLLALAFAASLFAVSLRFWFYGPRLITAASTLCFGASLA